LLLLAVAFALLLLAAASARSLRASVRASVSDTDDLLSTL